MAPMTIYTTSWCGFCRRLKSQLDREGIGYEEIDTRPDVPHDDMNFVSSIDDANVGNAPGRKLPRRVVRPSPVATKP